MELNARLYSLRLAEGLSFKKLSKKTNISSFRLRHFEEGVATPTDKELASLASFYGFDLGELKKEKRFGYSEYIVEAAPTSVSKLKSFFFSRVSFYLAIVLLGGALSSTFLSLARIDEADHHPEQFYSSGYNALLSHVLTNGEEAPLIDFLEDGEKEEPLLKENDKAVPSDSSWYEASLSYLELSFTEGSQEVEVQAPTENIFYGRMLYSIKDLAEGYSVSYSSPSDMAVSFSLTALDEEGELLFSTKTGTRDETKDEASSFTVLDDKGEEKTVHSALEGEEGYEEYRRLSESLSEYLSKSDLIAESILGEKGFLATEETFKSFLMSQASGNKKVEHYTLYASARLLVYSLLVFINVLYCLAVFPSALRRDFPSWTSVNGLYRGRHPEKRFNLESKQKAPLPPDIRAKPFIPEIAIRFIGVILITLGSLAVYLKIRPFLSFIGLNEVNKELCQGLALVFSYFTPIATILLFFTKIDILHNKEAILKQAITFFIAGLLFYAEEISILYMILRGFSGTGLLSMVASVFVTESLPENIFWSICVFSFIAFFLFLTPSFIKSKKGLIGFRLLSLLPTAYLIGSFVFNIGRGMGYWNANPFIRYLLGSNSPTTGSFAILYLYGLYFYKLHLKRLYGSEGGELYASGNRFMFTKNVYACLLLGALSLVDFLLSKDASLAKNGFGNNVFVFALIPLVLFYRPWTQERKSLPDTVFLTCYTIGSMDSYILLAVIFLLTFGWIDFDFLWMFH